MLLLRVAQFVKHGEEGRGACDGVHQQAASTTIGVVGKVRPCEVGLGGKGTFHRNSVIAKRLERSGKNYELCYRPQDACSEAERIKLSTQSVLG